MSDLSLTELEKLTKNQLLDLVKRDIVKVVNTENKPLNPSKEQRPEYQKFINLRGVPISISEASRKYNVAHPTIVRWTQRGHIKRLGMDRNRVLIDEADIAYCAEIYRSRSGQGKWLFNQDGTPYVPKT